MYLIDTNILIYGVHRESRYHKKAQAFLKECAADTDRTWFCTWVNIFEYLRVVTHPSVFKKPQIWEEAWQNIEMILDLPHTQVIQEEKEFTGILGQVIQDAGIVSGNLVHDTHIAALMKQEGVNKIYTLDTHFRIFSFLEVINPL